jgi:hypothetical protein
VISHAQAVAAAAREFGVPPPPANADGDAIFDVNDGFSLAVRSLPGDTGLLTWTKVAASSRPPEAERVLRLHLARTGSAARGRGAGGMVATRGDDGALLLYARSEADTETEWLESAAALLNEAEALRRHMVWL